MIDIPNAAQPMENVRLNITISEYDYHKLRNWAKVHGKTPTAFAGQIVATGIESNLNLINQQVAEIARYKGKSVEELENEWAGESE